MRFGVCTRSQIPFDKLAKLTTVSKSPKTIYMSSKTRRNDTFSTLFAVTRLLVSFKSEGTRRKVHFL